MNTLIRFQPRAASVQHMLTRHVSRWHFAGLGMFAALVGLLQSSLAADRSPSMTAAGSGKELPPVVAQALRAVDQVNLKEWAYTVTSKHGEKEMVERHNPNAAKGKTWELVTRQGKEPTEDQLKRYSKSARHRSKNPIQQFRSMIDRSSIQVVKEDERHLVCEFRIKPTDEDVKMVADKLVGTMRIAKDTGALQDLEVVNTERISKFATLSIRELKVNMSFKHDAQRGMTLPEHLNIKLRGRALWVKSLDFDSAARYTDLRYVGKNRAAGGTDEDQPASP